MLLGEPVLTSHQQGRFLFGDDTEEPDRVNEQYCRALRQCWKDPEFLEVMARVGGSLGSHSNQKFPATWCVENGCPEIEVEVRGRWKRKANGRIINRRICTEQLPTDAKLAGILAVGGPVRYKLKDDIHVSHQFLINTVVPKIQEHFSGNPSNRIDDVLAVPLLWA